jgi:hypothetical protein
MMEVLRHRKEKRFSQSLKLKSLCYCVSFSFISLLTFLTITFLLNFKDLKFISFASNAQLGGRNKREEGKQPMEKGRGKRLLDSIIEANPF